MPSRECKGTEVVAVAEVLLTILVRWLQSLLLGPDSGIDMVAVDACTQLVQHRLPTVANLASSMPTIDEFLGISQAADRVGAS